MPSTLMPRTRRGIVTTALAASVTAALAACAAGLPPDPEVASTSAGMKIDAAGVDARSTGTRSAPNSAC
ncbi:hypothetical protein [Streptomyces sp. NPDC057686]|uniref:hypothetical protein n=1 Tax=Streptomyces sp. NPDC057686 TaxID=3346212 RepID=UPI0036C754F3